MDRHAIITKQSVMPNCWSGMVVSQAYNSGIRLLPFKFYQLVWLSIVGERKKQNFIIGSVAWLGSSGWFLVGVSFVVVVREQLLVRVN